MNRRFWLYLSSALIIALLFFFGSREKVAINKAAIAGQAQALSSQQQSLERYLDKQTDGRKLIRLIKHLPNTEPKIIEQIADRAYQLSPDSRDAVLLASQFHSELKAQLNKIDPLYQQK